MVKYATPNYMKILLLLISLVITSLTFAQAHWQVPQYDEIKKVITAENSDNNYDKLLRRFNDLDTTLSDEHYFVLYYGQYFQDSYKPSNSGNNLIKKMGRSVDEKSYLTFKDSLIATKHLYPFDLRALSMGSVLAHRFADNEFATKLDRQLIGILKSIFSTGDGKSLETALHVLNVSDEYVVCDILNVSVTGQRTVKNCDFLTTENTHVFEKGIYFNIEKIFEGYAKLFGKKDNP